MSVNPVCSNFWTMRRLFALTVLALSLAMASGPAFAVPKADCPMAASHQMQGGDGGMDCCAETCAPACAAVCPNAAVAPPGGGAAPVELMGNQLAIGPLQALPSAKPSSIDPPPRTTFS